MPPSIRGRLARLGALAALTALPALLASVAAHAASPAAAAPVMPTDPPAGVFLFAPGSARLSAESQPLLDRLAAQAKADLGRWIVLVACTADYNSQAMNLALHQQRLDAIEQEIVARGILAHRVRGINAVDGCATSDGRKTPRVEARFERP